MLSSKLRVISRMSHVPDEIPLKLVHQRHNILLGILRDVRLSRQKVLSQALEKVLIDLDHDLELLFRLVDAEVVSLHEEPDRIGERLCIDLLESRELDVEGVVVIERERDDPNLEQRERRLIFLLAQLDPHDEERGRPPPR